MSEIPDSKEQSESSENIFENIEKDFENLENNYYIQDLLKQYMQDRHKAPIKTYLKTRIDKGVKMNPSDQRTFLNRHLLDFNDARKSSICHSNKQNNNVLILTSEARRYLNKKYSV